MDFTNKTRFTRTKEDQLFEITKIQTSLPTKKAQECAIKPSEMAFISILGGKIIKNVQIDPQTTAETAKRNVVGERARR